MSEQLSNIRVIDVGGSRPHWLIKEPRTTPRADGETYHHKEYVPKDGRWTFNGDYTNPTFSPSINSSHEALPNINIPEWRNHFIITGGKIQYCGDCTHELAGQTLELAFFTEAEVKCHTA